MKKLRTIMIVFALVLTMSIVYAATQGSWDITGTGNLSGINVELTSATAASSVGNSTGSWGEDKKTLVANFVNPGDSLIFSFELENKSTTAVTITEITITKKPSSDEGIFEALEFSADLGENKEIEITGSAGALTTGSLTDHDITIDKGEKLLQCAIIVEWLEDAATSNGQAIFLISIKYEKSGVITGP